MYFLRKSLQANHSFLGRKSGKNIKTIEICSFSSFASVFFFPNKFEYIGDFCPWKSLHPTHPLLPEKENRTGIKNTISPIRYVRGNVLTIRHYWNYFQNVNRTDLWNVALASGTPKADLLWLHTGWTFKTVTFLKHYSKKMIFFQNHDFLDYSLKNLFEGEFIPGGQKY